MALSICKTLRQHGYMAYFAGGYVRDHLLKIPSDDIDIATDASPEKIQSLFDKTIPLGIAFGIVVVVIQKFSFEVATFRKDLSYSDGRRPAGIAFCSPKEDALRRDFTINGMFYDPIEKKIYDYVDGQKDLQHRVIKAIGNPHERFQEDKLRMIRACRFSARFDFKIEKETKQAILSLASQLLPAVSIERVYQEFQKMKGHNFVQALLLLFELKLLEQVFPTLKNLTEADLKTYLHAFGHLPKNCPTALFLLELFPKYSLDQQVALLEYLKVSNEKIKLATFCYECRTLLQAACSDYSWVKMIANSSFDLALHILTARLSSDKRAHLLKSYLEKKEQLKIHIQRKIAGNPLVTSHFLMSHGLIPGKHLGQVLEKAEEIAINLNLQTPEQVLSHLKKDPLWQKN